MKKEVNWGYRILLIFLAIVLGLGIFLLVMGLMMGPNPLTMPWTYSI